MGHDVSSSNVLGNFTGQYETGDFIFNSSSTVTGVSTANNSNANAFRESIFIMNTIRFGTSMQGMKERRVLVPDNKEKRK